MRGGRAQQQQIHFPNGGFPPVFIIEQNEAKQIEQNKNRQIAANPAAISIKAILNEKKEKAKKP